MPAGRSNALNIASRLGLDPDIIDAARQRLAVGVAAANAAIEKLESVQEELRAADMVLFAVKANAEETKVSWPVPAGGVCRQHHSSLLLIGNDSSVANSSTAAEATAKLELELQAFVLMLRAVIGARPVVPGFVTLRDHN